MANFESSQVDSDRRAEPAIMVIFGASGDLTKRKLIPSLFHLYCEGLLPTNFVIVGVARRDLTATFVQDMKAAILQYSAIAQSKQNEQTCDLDDFVSKIKYHTMSFTDVNGYVHLKNFLAEIDEQHGTLGNRLFYLSTAPEHFWDIVQELGNNGMMNETSENGGNYSRIIIEKPFGHDLQSARELNEKVNRVFNEEQIFRIDHYLGKEKVQNILVFRFANSIFESVWNRNYIDNIQITSAEDIGIEGRGPFYEKAGALRDVVQNHIMAVLALVTMEPPISFDARAIRDEKLKLWRSILPIDINKVVRGQYGGGYVHGIPVNSYREEERVASDSSTETFVSLKMEIDNWRWAGVPIYVRVGKRLPKKVTNIVIQFKKPPTLLFGERSIENELQPNLLIIRIQPDEGISIRFGAKVPGPNTHVRPVEMDFSYAQAFEIGSTTGYERLLLDALLGDQTLFTHRNGIEVAWRLFTPILEYWSRHKPLNFPNYESGTWGPIEAFVLLAKDGREWVNF